MKVVALFCHAGRPATLAMGEKPGSRFCPECSLADDPSSEQKSDHSSTGKGFFLYISSSSFVFEFIYLLANVEQLINNFYFPGQGLNLNTQVKEQLPYSLKSEACSRLISQRRVSAGRQGRGCNDTVGSVRSSDPANRCCCAAQSCPAPPQRSPAPFTSQGAWAGVPPAAAALLPGDAVAAGLAVSATPVFWGGGKPLCAPCPPSGARD